MTLKMTTAQVVETSSHCHQQFFSELHSPRRSHYTNYSNSCLSLLCFCTGGQLTGRKVTDMWYEEHDKYRYSNPGFSTHTGHFTQIAWQSSKEMGAGKAVSSTGAQFVVARYQPPGNVRGQFPENVKPPTGSGGGGMWAQHRNCMSPRYVLFNKVSSRSFKWL